MDSEDYIDVANELSEEDEAMDCSDDDAYADSCFLKEAAEPQQNFTILTEADIGQRMKDDITRLSMILSISGIEASILLRHYDWSFSKVNDAWFADANGVREKVGLLKKPVLVDETKELTCGICFDSYQSERFNWAACGHPYCSECWLGYITTSINNDGPRCLMLRCPDPKCCVAVGQDIIDLLASEEDKRKYAKCLVKSYVGQNRKTKWCPAVGCEYAVDYVAGGESFDVTCLCSHSFCFNCTEEAHRPVHCETVQKWILKNSSESENTNYIFGYTKPCPKCGSAIEKNGGCMSMYCKCGTCFCWLCLRPDSLHDSVSCNSYKKGNNEDAEKKERTKEYIERYTHYFERLAANHKSSQKALADLEKIKNMQLKKLSEIQRQPEGLLQYIIEAWLQIVECRRVLKWTSVYGYYLPNSEQAKRNFFEYLQGEAGTALEKLHRCVEQELQEFVSAEEPSMKFINFRTKLVGLTVVTRNYFEKLIKALENGLSDVNPHVHNGLMHLQNAGDYWPCDRCTFANPGSVSRCQVCVLPDKIV